VVISNAVINLSFRKRRVVAKTFRCWKPALPPKDTLSHDPHFRTSTTVTGTILPEISKQVRGNSRRRRGCRGDLPVPPA
jgi:hypothetical protein